MEGETSLEHDRYNILIEFAHLHLDFQRAELDSILSMHNIRIGRDCNIIPLPNCESSTENNHNRPFLVLSFSSEYANSEFDLESQNINSKDGGSKPTIASILSRCVLIRSAIHLWGMGVDFDACTESMNPMTKSQEFLELFSHYRHESNSWKITVQTLGSKYTRDEQNDMRAKFNFLGFSGPVQMEGPTNEYLILREIELDQMGSPKYPRHGLNKKIIPENDARPPFGVYFGRILGGTRDWRAAGNLEQYNLKKRAYLGPTSMDSQLSLVMSNLGKVKKGSFCFDPFAGTGSILLTCALRGGYCFGTDIDIRVLRGRGVNENVLSNFKQYNLLRPDLVRSDNAIYHRHFRTHAPMFDAIVCDPPYGIRAGARKSGSKLDKPRPVPEDCRHDHIAQTKVYEVSDVMGDLLDVAARTLVMEGRLVYIIPSMQDFNVETDLPSHDCLKLVHVCYQPLQTELGRRIVTMQKVKDYDVSQRSKYLSAVWVNGKESAEKCARIRDRLLEAAKLKPGYEEKAAFRKKKRQETREAKKRAKLEAETAS